MRSPRAATAFASADNSDIVMETTNLILGLIFSSIGIGYFIYGRKQSNIVARYCGLALLLYPYLVTDTLTMVAVGIGLMVTPRFIEM